MATDPRSYTGRTLRSIEKHCERRGMTAAETKAAVKALGDHYGTPVDKMDGSALKRLNRDLSALLTNVILGGAKRAVEDDGLTDAGRAAFDE